PSITSASSIITNQSFGDFDMTLRMKTVQQLRTGSTPHTWEVAWVIFHHIDRLNAYYFLPNPNGWELGKAVPCASCPWGGQGQIFLATGGYPTFSVGSWLTVRVRMVG